MRSWTLMLPASTAGFSNVIIIMFSFDRHHIPTTIVLVAYAVFSVAANGSSLVRPKLFIDRGVCPREG
jgi:hypothetical protein